MNRFNCNECGYVWFYPLHYTNQIDKFKSGSSYWSEMENRINVCPHCGYNPFPESRWWLQPWRPESNNYWRTRRLLISKTVRCPWEEQDHRDPIKNMHDCYSCRFYRRHTTDLTLLGCDYPGDGKL